MSDEPAAERVGALAPFHNPTFGVLWAGVVFSSIGAWAQTVGAQWLFINDPNAATIVSLVQTAATLPMMLFSLAAGVLADAFDRGRILLWVQVYFLVVAGLLAALTALDRMPPLLLLAFTFAIGVGNAVLVSTWQPLITELVPRAHLAAAIRLDMVSVNVARAVGPAIAGVVIAAWGVPPVFALNAALTLFLIVALLTWRRPARDAPSAARERFLPALRTGGRYVRHEPVVRLILTRLAIFVAPATAMWALLALIANRQLGLGADGYGFLYGALGVGAVAAAFTVGRLGGRFSANTLLSVMAIVYGAAFALTMAMPGIAGALPLLVVLGYAWTATVAILNAELQLFLPGWVRARAVAVYMMTFTGAQALASPVWGLLAQHVSLAAAVWIASALVVLGGLVGFAWHFPESSGLDRSPLAFWNDAMLVVEPEPDAGPVQVNVEYVVEQANYAAWRTAMDGMRRSRLRSGASRWDLYRVGERADTYLEVFTVPSWAEHLHQHQTRLTAEDQAIEEHAFSFTALPPKAEHLLPTDPD
ncbi:MFS transporter [Propionicimonas sp.]|uniref:MFS transporter n=1 Tax=Propionicimonas sp. TaxID=1955623 RepID=UPI0039E46C63